MGYDDELEPWELGGDAYREMGDQRPRLSHFPRGAVSSAGAEAIKLAAKAGLVLDPWQAWVLDQSLSERADGKWAAWEVALICSRQNGKSAILEARELAGLFLFGEELIIHTAHEFKTSSESFRRILRWITNLRDADRRVSRITTSHGEEGIELKSGQRLRFLARSRTSARGFTSDLLIYDEAMILSREDIGASLPTLSARDGFTEGGTQVWYAGSAGIGKPSGQLAAVRRRGLARRSRRLAFMEWSIDPHSEHCPPGCDEHDDPAAPASVAKSNPALGYRLTIEAVERERDAMDAGQFECERLGVGAYPAPRDGWAVIPRKWWDGMEIDDPPRPAVPAFAVDITRDRSSAAIAAAGSLPGGKWLVEVIDHAPGTAWIVPRLAELEARHRPSAIVLDKIAAAGSLLSDLDDAGVKVTCPTAGEVIQACGQFYDACRDDALRHAGSATLANALAGAAKRELAGAWAWDRVNVAVDISPLVAVTLALWGHRKFGVADYSVGGSVGFGLQTIIGYVERGVYGPADIARLYARGVITDAMLGPLADAGVPVPAGVG